MQCDASIGSYDGEQASFYTESEVRARKVHVCYECRSTIAKGESYHRVSGRWDGEFCCYAFCLACWEIATEFADGPFTFGTVWEEMRDNWGSGSRITACLNRLTTADAKRKLHGVWLSWKGLDA